MLNTTLNFVYFFGFLSFAWLGKKDSTFWSVTQLLLGEQQPTTPQCVEECYRFNMAPINLQLIKKRAPAPVLL